MIGKMDGYIWYHIYVTCTLKLRTNLWGVRGAKKRAGISPPWGMMKDRRRERKRKTPHSGERGDGSAGYGLVHVNDGEHDRAGGKEKLGGFTMNGERWRGYIVWGGGFWDGYVGHGW